MAGLDTIADIGLPSKEGGVVVAVDPSTVVDNIFTFADAGGKKWKRQADGVYRAAWIVTSTGDQTARLQAAFNDSRVNEIIFDKGDIVINGNLTIPLNKVISFKNRARLIGTGSITVYLKDLRYNKYQCFGADLAVKMISQGDELHPEIFGAVANDSSFDNAPIFNKIFRSIFNGPATAASNSPGDLSIIIKIIGNYYIRDTIQIRNVTPIFKGNGQINGGAFEAGGDITSKINAPAIVANSFYTVNQYRIWAPPVGNLTITIPGMANGTTVYYSIADRDWSGSKAAVRKGTFIYNGPDTLVFRDYRVGYSETIHMSTSYVGYNDINFEYGATGATAFETSLVNQTGQQITSLRFSGIEFLSGPVNNNTHFVAPTVALGPVPPYQVKVTMTGVSDGTTLHCTRIADGVVVGDSTFLYSGPDSVAFSGYVPSVNTLTKKLNEWFVIGTSAAIASVTNGKWAIYGNSVGIINSVAGSTITSWKFDDDDQMSKYLWQDKAMISISGCDNLEIRDITMYSQASLNPLQNPYAAIHTYIDITNPNVAVKTQREHVYSKIFFKNSTFPDSGQWQKYRSFYANFAVDGAYGNNDMFKFYHCNFSQAQYCYFNDNQQAVAHTLSECYWNQCDWGIASLGGMVSIWKAFIGFGMSHGFIKVIGTSNESINYQIYDFNTEGIAGWFFIFGWGGCAINVDMYSPQPVFWNTYAGTQREFYLIAASQITQVKFNSYGGNWIMGNGGGAGLAKIRLGSLNTSGTCSVSIRNSFFYPNSLGSLAIEVFNSNFMLELNSASGSYAQGYAGHIFRSWISQFEDLWPKYAAIDTANNGYINLATLMSNANIDLQTNSTGTPWVDFGQSGRLGTFALGVASYWFRVATAAHEVLTSSSPLKATRMIRSVAVKNAQPQLVNDVSPDNPTILSYGTLYIGDAFDYKRWGSLNTFTAGNKNTNPISAVSYQSNQNILFTAVYKSPDSVTATLANTGVVTFTSPILGGSATSIDSLIGRKIWFTSGEFAGLSATITGRVSATALSTDLTGVIISSGVSFEVEGRMQPSPGAGVMSILITITQEESNRNGKAIQYQEENIPQLT